MKLVMKFGGTSLSGGGKIRRIARSVGLLAGKNTIICVASALDDVTDRLIRISDFAKSGQWALVEKGLTEIEAIHLSVARTAIRKQSYLKEAENKTTASIGNLTKLLMGISTLRELSARSRDLILSFGEGLSAPILSIALQEANVHSISFQGGEAGIITNDKFGEAHPLMNVTRREVKLRLDDLINKKVVPVICGFTGATQNGDITTLGRGGSDYTASILGSALDADEIWICTDTDGIMTADPKIVKDARLITELSYGEASEMALFGAKGMHPSSLEPAIERKIPIRVKNSMNLDNGGTLITDRSRVRKGFVVKVVALVQDVALINVGGSAMVGMPGMAAKIFDVLGKSGVNIMMISQSVSESNISLVIRRGLLQKALTALELSLLGSGSFKKIDSNDDVGIIAVLGEGMKGTPGIAAKLFGALGRASINVIMVTQGSSESNVSLMVKSSDCVRAVKTIHDEFQLSKIGHKTHISKKG